MKDLFSSVAGNYVKFRPCYPQQLYDFLFEVTHGRDTAWDCATGNGQVAAELAKHFKQVFATDISQNQLSNAVRKENIHYKTEPAEQSSFPDNFFDLITVAQAVHWVDFDKFYAEVKRTAKRNSIIAIIGYGLFKSDEYVNHVIQKLEAEYIGSYWDSETKYLDDGYRTIPFPFKEIKAPAIEHVCEWPFERLIGYLNTWSAVQKYIKANGTNPVERIYEELKIGWEEGATKTIRFEILLRVGLIK